LENKRRLYRSDNAMIAGVCGGLAEYFGFDPSIVRILAVVLLVLLLGTPALLYLVMIFIIPRQPLDINQPIDIKASVTSEIAAVRNQGRTPGAAWVSSNPEAFDAAETDVSRAPGQRLSGRGLSAATTLGLMLIGFGIIALLGLFINPFFWTYWPLVVILVGLITLFSPGYNGWRVARAGYSILMVTVGILLQLSCLGYFAWTVWLETFVTLWPVGLIGVGLVLIGGTLRRDIFKLAAALLLSLTLVVGIWTFGQIGGLYHIDLPLFNGFDLEMPRSPLPW